MEQIVVKHRDNTPLLLNSQANISGITKAEQKVGLLSDDLTDITVESATPLKFELGDTIDVFGKTYTLNFLPTIKKTGKRKFSYELTFEGPQYELLDVQFLLPDDTTGDSFTGNLKDFLEVLLQNIRRIFPGKWALGEYPADTEYKTLSYVGENCLSVLQNLCKEHNIEFEIEQTNGVKTLHIRKAGVNFPYTFRYGRTGGLYELTRKNINSKNVVTRLYVYGGSNNLGSKYRYSKLCLPGKTKNKSYIENAAAIAAFGVKENTKTFDEIFPNRYGKVTGKGTKYYAFVDSTMNFDLNEKDSEGTKWLIEGVNAKVKFTTGNLAGYEFDVHKYDHATKTIELVPFTDENGMKFPSETSAAFQFQAGDVYFFTDINLPDSYKTDAEIQLSTEGTEYYNQNCQPQAEYGLNIDQNFIKQFAGELTVVNLFAVGDYIPVEDTDIGVNKSIRITGFTRDLLKPYKYSLTLGDSVTQSTYTRIISDLKEIDRVIEINDLADPAKARRNWKASQEVLAMVFDPEGDYYTDKIKPGSIETLMLSVGAKSMQFMLQNTLIEANYQGNKNSVKVTGGVLTHYTISDKILNWNLATATTALASDSTAYYIYAKCQKAGNAGSIIFSTTQITVDQDPNYYHFWVGVVNSVVDEVRAVSLTYGATTINGKFIRTGQIESSDGSCFINLDGNGFRLGDSASSLAWNNNKDRKLRLKGTLIQSPSGDENALGVFRGSYSSYSLYYKGDEVTYNGSMYRCIQNCPTAGIMPINTTYWQLIAQKGTDGDKGDKGDKGEQGIQGPKGSDGLTTYFHIKYAPVQTPTASQMTETPDIFIGTYVDTTPTDSSDPKKYTWARFQGIQGPTGEKGIPGVNGANGKTSYLHIKYSDDGTTFTANNGETPGEWIGQYTDFTETDSSIFSKYNWTKVKGENGEIAPTGKMLYRNPDFSEGLNGIGVYNNYSNGNTYIERIARISDCPNNSTHCIRITNKGDATPGLGGFYFGNTSRANAKFMTRIIAKIPAGYTISWHSNATGSGGYTKWITPTAGTGKFEEYVCIVQCGASGEFSSTNYFAIHGPVAGPATPVVWYLAYATVFDATQAEVDYLEEIENSIDVQAVYVYRGNYASNVSYTATNQHIDIVKYNSVYYRARRKINGSFSNQTPGDNSAYWENFGAQFESIATNLILAEYANLGGLIFRNEKLISQTGYIGNIISNDFENPNFKPNIEIDGKHGHIYLNGFFASRFSTSYENTQEDYPKTMNFIVTDNSSLNFDLPNSEMYIGSILTVYLDKTITGDSSVRIGSPISGGIPSYKGQSIVLLAKNKGTFVRLMATKFVEGRLQWELINFDSKHFSLVTLVGSYTILDRSAISSDRSFSDLPSLFNYWNTI